MSVSVFDLFRVGIGPSSSHTVGPMRAARTFALGLEKEGLLPRVATVQAELHGSLGATGRGHGSDRAVVLGLLGETPEDVDLAHIPALLARIREQQRLPLLGRHPVHFDEARDLRLHCRRLLFHPNGLRLTAWDKGGVELRERTFYSVGGGFVVEAGEEAPGPPGPSLPFPFASGKDLLDLTTRHGSSVSSLMLANEAARRPVEEVQTRLLQLWSAMQECVRRGCREKGELPGGLGLIRRAPALHRSLLDSPEAGLRDPLTAIDWVTLYALAVNEENAAGGRVVTAPTNGAAGVIPAVLHYYTRFVPGADDEGVARFLLTAGAVGSLFKENASISGAEVGCQGEVGAACSMAAAGLCEVLGGSPAQVENAAEIGMEHNLGLTCDPIGGLVQVPCIERNAMAAVKAIHAARLALRGDGVHFVPLDAVIRTMRETGTDMKEKYKETARGGLATQAGETRPVLSVGLAEC